MDDANILSQVIANNWEQWAPMFGEQRETFECRLTILLRQLESAKAADQQTAIQAVLDLFRPFTAIYRLLHQAVTSSAANLHKGGGTNPLFVKKDRHEIVPVFYGTNRAASTGHNVSLSYGAERGELSYGIADVSIPDDHRMGQIERPRLWKLQFTADHTAHVTLLGTASLSPAAFVENAKSALSQCAKKEVLLFVHGYNVKFEDALLRTAQIAYDLHFVGIPALFSWPSEGSTPKYAVDMNNITWSRPHFAEFLRVLREQLAAETVHIIAHSMGNRLIAETISSMTSAQAMSGARIRQIVLAAPDVDAGTFKNFAKSFSEKADQFTLYASSHDLALAASKFVNKYPLAGDAGPNLVIVEPVDTVDASEVDTSFMGHSYYGENRSVLSDIFHVIRNGTPPQNRQLKEMTRDGQRYWLFNP